MNVSAVIVTRGNVELDAILASLPEEWEVIIWDNSRGWWKVPPPPVFTEEGIIRHEILREQVPDLGVYGRYAAIEHASHDVIFVQDDDCIVPARTIVDAYEPGRLVANMPESRWAGYPDSVMVGWGAVLDRDLPEKAFQRFKEGSDFLSSGPYERVEIYRRTCDIVFSMLTPRTVIDVGFQHLPWAEGPGRMWTSNPDHGPERDRMVELCRRIRTWPDDDRRIPAS